MWYSSAAAFMAILASLTDQCLMRTAPKWSASVRSPGVLTAPRGAGYHRLIISRARPGGGGATRPTSPGEERRVYPHCLNEKFLIRVSSMHLPPDFRKSLKEKSNRELTEMLVHEHDYLPEALDAAAEEIGGRNLSAAELQRNRSLVAAADVESAREHAGPSPGAWILSHFMWQIFLGILALVAIALRWCFGW